jgi:hypothetical protein
MVLGRLSTILTRALSLQAQSYASRCLMQATFRSKMNFKLACQSFIGLKKMIDTGLYGLMNRKNRVCFFFSRNFTTKKTLTNILELPF